MVAKVYKSGSFADITVKKRWANSAWVDITIGKRWTGSAWVDVFPAPVDPPPVGSPVATWDDATPTFQDSYYCEDWIDSPPVLQCPAGWVFTLTLTFTASNYTSITLKPESGMSMVVTGNSVTFSCYIASSPVSNQVTKNPTINFVNANGSVSLTKSWTLVYLYERQTGPQP